MASISSILPIIVGEIKAGSEEEYDLWKINCVSDSSERSDSMSGVEVEILFPCNDDHIVPLAGGSIIRLGTLTNEVDTSSTAESDSNSTINKAEVNVARRAAYDLLTKRLATSVSEIKSDDMVNPNITSLIDLTGKIRTEVNKALRDMPNTLSGWAHAGVPSLLLSSYRSSDGSVSDAEDLSSLISDAKNSSTRPPGLNRVGYFKFIPIEVVIDTISAMAGKHAAQEPGISAGMSNIAGFSGSTFGEISSNIKDALEAEADLESSDIIDMLLEVFPILRVDDEFIIGEEFGSPIGFYTVYKNSVYVKLPDLSGKNSVGFTNNLYDIGVDGGDSITFCFEMRVERELVTLAFDTKGPPAPELASLSERYPSSADLEVYFNLEGIDQDKMSDYTFYLSPVATPSTAGSHIGGNKLKARIDELEIFTAPVLFKSYFEGAGKLSTLLSAYSKAEGNYEDKETLEDIFTKYSAEVGSSHPLSGIYKSLASSLDDGLIFAGSEGRTVEYSDSDVASSLLISFGNNEYKIEELGLPNTVSLGAIGASVETLVGEKNRPDILLKTSTEENALQHVLENDKKLFGDKIGATCPAAVSNRPNIYSKNIIPSLWIENSGSPSKVTEFGEEFILVRFIISSFTSKYMTNGKVKFAVYAMDELGQMSKVPGAYFRLEEAIPVLNSVSPNGHAEDGVVLASTDYVNITFSGSELSDVIGVEFCPEGSDECLNYVALDSGDFITLKSETAIMVGSGGLLTSSEGTYGDLTGLGANAGVIHARLVSENGQRSTAIPINISTTDTDVNDLEGASPMVAPIEEPYESFFAQKFDSKCIEGLPVLQDSQNAKIKIKSKKGLLGGKYDLYAYLLVAGGDDTEASDIVRDFGRESDIVKVVGGGMWPGSSSEIKGYLAKNIEYKFSESGGDFYSNGSKEATILFPGSGHSSLNFSRLKKAGQAYFLILNSQIDGFAQDGEISLSEDGSIGEAKQCYGLIPIGRPGKSDPAFVGPPVVEGLFASLPGKNRIASNITLGSKSGLSETTKESLNAELDRRGLVAGARPATKIVAADKLSKLGILIRGSGGWSDGFMGIGKTHTAYLGTDKIKDERRNIKQLGSGDIFAYFTDVSTSKEGWQEISVEKKDKNYGVTYSSTVYKRITVTIPNGDVFELVDGVNTYTGEEYRISGKPDGWESNGVTARAANEPELSAGRTTLQSNEHHILIPNSGVAQASGSFFNDDSNFRVIFSNPVKLIPDTDLKFGEGEGTTMLGLALDGSSEETSIAEISKYGTVEQELSLDMLSGVADTLSGGLDSLENMATSAGSAILGGGSGSDTGYCLNTEDASLYEGVITSDADTDTDTDTDTDADADDGGEAEAIVDDDGELSPEEAAAIIDSGDGDGASIGDAITGAVGDAQDAIEGAADTITGLADDLNSIAGSITDALSSASDLVNSLAGDAEDMLESMTGQYTHVNEVDVRSIFLVNGAEVNSSNILEPSDGTTEDWKVVVSIEIENASAIKFNVPELIRVHKLPNTSITYDPHVAKLNPSNPTVKPLTSLVVEKGNKLQVVSIGSNKNTKYEIAGKRVGAKGELVADGLEMTATVIVPDFSGLSIFGSDPCINFGLTNSNENRMRMSAQIGNDETLSMDDDWQSKMFGPGKSGRGPAGDLKEMLAKAKLKIGPQIMDKAAIAKEFINSFCDFSFHLTKELQFNLKNLRLLYIPIKIIFCIIDVICALLNPIRLAIAIIRLFICLFDLILLLPQIAVPVMYLYLLLHILQLLQCVILKILGWIIAINDIIVAIDNAITYHNYPAIVALEETLNEHLFSLEADLEVLEPIITILGIFLELLQLVFRFPCSIDEDDVDPMCIDPSMIAGIIVGKVAPTGPIEPTNLLPMAQSYCQTSPEDTGGYGNTPPSEAWNSKTGVDLIMPSEQAAGVVVSAYSEVLDDDGNIESIYLGEEDSNGYANVAADNLRFQTGTFDATFGVSFTRSKKGFAIFKGPDPRIVTMEFNSKGLTSEWAYNWFFGIFIKGKIIDNLQTLDDPPLFLEEDDGNLVMEKSSTNYNFISPLDGFSEFLDSSRNVRPLTIELSSYSQEVDDDGVPLDELTETKYEKTFSNIPMVAVVDHEFNVYFIEDGGIEIDPDTNGIASIKAKMINFPTAPKHKSGKDKVDVFKTTDEDGEGGSFNGETMIKMQANANFLLADQLYNDEDAGTYLLSFNADPENAGTVHPGKLDVGDWNTLMLNLGETADSALSEEDLTELLESVGIPFPDVGVYDYLDENAHRKDTKAIGQAMDTVKVFDFPRLYFVDVRQCADEIAAACQAADMNESLFNWTLDQGLEWPGDFEPLLTGALDCIEGFRKHFQDGIDDIRSVIGDDTQTKEEFRLALSESKFDIPEAEVKYNELYQCIADAVEDCCPWVVNPLNTGFKLMGDEGEDEEELGLAIDPAIVDDVIMDDLDFDFPSVTGAAEFASGIGDFLILEAGEKAFIEIIPRDSHDDPLPDSWDARSSIKIEIVKDETSTGAYLTEVNDGEGETLVKEDEVYLAAITSDTPGKVMVRASLCGTVVQAWAERGVTAVEESEEEEDLTGVDCVPDSVEVDSDGDEVFAPGSIMRVDRVLTILFTARMGTSSGTGYGDGDRDASAELAKSSPQSTGTKLEN